MTAGPDRSRRILVLSGGLIHLVHQLAAVCSLSEVAAGSAAPTALPLVPIRDPSAGGDGGQAQAVPPPAQIAVLITGVLNRNPAALALLQDERGADAVEDAVANGPEMRGGCWWGIRVIISATAVLPSVSGASGARP